MTHCYISGSITEILSQQQRRLTNYHYHSQSCDVPPTTARSIDPLAWVTSVRLHLGSENDCRRAAGIIARTPDITELSIFFETRLKLPGFFAKSCRDFIIILFAMKDTRRQLPRLRSLFLECFTLTFLGPILSQSINFSKLEELQLLKCDDVGHMLLSLELQQMDWNVLRIEEDDSGDDSGKLKTFLQTMQGPKILSISRERRFAEEDDEGKLCWTDLVPHSATLKSLRFNIEQAGDYPFHDRCGTSVADFRELCNSASNLEQLALTCPPVEEEKWQGEHGLAVFLVRAPIVLKIRE